MRSKFRAEGSLIAHIAVGNNISFEIGSNVKINILEQGENSKRFILEGTYEGTDVYDYINKAVDNFCSFLSFIANAPISQVTFSSSSVQEEDTTTVTTNKTLTMSYNIQGKGCIVAPWSEEKSKSLNNILSKYNTTPLPITLFIKALSEDSNYAKFWYFYNILQILIGDRAKIDKHLKLEYPGIKTLYSDFEKRDVTITIAIRDSFSHPSTYNGVSLDFNNELSGHINDLKGMARDILTKKYLP